MEGVWIFNRAQISDVGTVSNNCAFSSNAASTSRLVAARPDNDKLMRGAYTLFDPNAFSWRSKFVVHSDVLSLSKWSCNCVAHCVYK